MNEPKSPLREQTELRWNFLEREKDPCAVVTKRMEIVFSNRAAKEVLPGDVFGKRCFEVMPVAKEQCAWECPTMRAVVEAAELVYCEEFLGPNEGGPRTLGVAVIPIGGFDLGPDASRAVLLFRDRPSESENEAFRESLLKDAEMLRERIDERLSDASS